MPVGNVGRHFLHTPSQKMFTVPVVQHEADLDRSIEEELQEQGCLYAKLAFRTVPGTEDCVATS